LSHFYCVNILFLVYHSIVCYFPNPFSLYLFYSAVSWTYFPVTFYSYFRYFPFRFSLHNFSIITIQYYLLSLLLEFILFTMTAIPYDVTLEELVSRVIFPIRLYYLPYSPYFTIFSISLKSHFYWRIKCFRPTDTVEKQNIYLIKYIRTARVAQKKHYKAK